MKAPRNVTIKTRQGSVTYAAGETVLPWNEAAVAKELGLSQPATTNQPSEAESSTEEQSSPPSQPAAPARKAGRRTSRKR